MDLLPTTSEEFSKKSYWDTFFKNIKDEPFEWYGEYDELAELLHKYISLKDNLLITGCGNSTLSFCLHRAGITNQISIDISDVVVNQMKVSYPDLNFMLEDVTRMGFEDEIFTCVLDKGTVDALTPPTESSSGSVEKSKVELMFDEVNRVTKKGGRFIIISLLQPHVAQKLFTYFHRAGWMIRVVRCSEVEEKALKLSADRIVFPIFMVVVTKVKLPPSISPVIEVACAGSSFSRLTSVDSLLSVILNQQGMMQLRRELMSIGAGAEKEIALRLVSKEGQDRFVFYVTDAMKLIKNPVEKRFGVFIVPEGRETEWLFGTHEGRIQLAQESNFTRLIVVHFMRGQTYASMESVQQEISGHIQFMMPRSVSERNIKVSS
ncbi:unnamed protein product [Allacma fusca]|uniref:Methyltransferase domain-containing protein n=1 Tax=Allacma fusca TaxID=39272 RepID=A0A8J2L2L0_9HEXA|nr:unnamed protein product [Allacma fusca]